MFLSPTILDMARASDVFNADADAKVKEVKSWLKSKGIQGLELVSVFSDHLAKVYKFSFIFSVVPLNVIYRALFKKLKGSPMISIRTGRRLQSRKL